MSYIRVMFVPGDDPNGPATQEVALYELPAKGEESCGGTCDRVKGKLNGWGRHPEKGYIVHQCGRPRRGRRARIRGALLDVLGVNLTPNAPALFENPRGW